ELSAPIFVKVSSRKEERGKKPSNRSPGWEQDTKTPIQRSKTDATPARGVHPDRQHKACRLLGLMHLKDIIACEAMWNSNKLRHAPIRPQDAPPLKTRTRAPPPLVRACIPTPSRTRPTWTIRRARSSDQPAFDKGVAEEERTR